MKKLILITLLLLPFNVLNASGSGTCKPPTKLNELDQALAKKVGSIKSANDTEIVSDALWGYRYSAILKIIETRFPKKYKVTFENYIKNFEKIEKAYKSGLLSEEDIKVRNFHYYILVDTIPVLLNDRLFFTVKSPSPERVLEEKANKESVWEKLSEELDYRNLEICKDEDEKKIKMPTAGKEKLYKTILENSPPRTINLYGNYEIPIPVLAKFASDPDSETVEEKDDFWSVFTRPFDFLNKSKKTYTAKNQVTSSSISPKNKLFLALEDEYNIKSRYMDWRNDRNFWITKTNKISGYNLDVFVEKYEIMLDILLMTNDQLTKSLEDVEKICKAQRVNVPCWASNAIPDHSGTLEISYPTRTAEKDN